MRTSLPKIRTTAMKAGTKPRKPPPETRFASKSREGRHLAAAERV